MTLFLQELKMNKRQLLAWTICIGVCCFGCILLFQGLEETMGEMQDVYAQMGAFAAAFGMNRMDAGTMEGFYATEISLIFAVGGAMFAAMLGICMLAKEEEGRTADGLPVVTDGKELSIWSKLTDGSRKCEEKIGKILIFVDHKVF